MEAAMETRMRKRPSQGRSRVTVTSILEAADRILRGDGYEAASTNRVARVAGFSVGSLYQYFRDKQAIVRTLIDSELRAEAELVVAQLDQNTNQSAAPLFASGFKVMLERRVARAHLYRTLDVHSAELGVPSILQQLVAAQAPALSDALQRIAAQALPRSTRKLDARLFALARLASGASFAYAVDAPPALSTSVLGAEFAAGAERYLAGPQPGPSALALAHGWAKPPTSVVTIAELRARRRREARGLLLTAGVDAAHLEARAFLLASLADVSAATENPPFALSQEDLLHEVARFSEALSAA